MSPPRGKEIDHPRYLKLQLSGHNLLSGTEICVPFEEGFFAPEGGNIPYPGTEI